MLIKSYSSLFGKPGEQRICDSSERILTEYKAIILSLRSEFLCLQHRYYPGGMMRDQADYPDASKTPNRHSVFILTPKKGVTKFKGFLNFRPGERQSHE